jgi:hypothetical protein
MAETKGEAADYYQSQPGPPPNEQYAAPEGPPPADSRQYYAPGPAPPQSYNTNAGEKYGFNDTFKVDKPKYNDIWATVLFLLVFAGFTAVSVISLRGYASNKSYNGNGIYDGNQTLALNTST